MSFRSNWLMAAALLSVGLPLNAQLPTTSRDTLSNGLSDATILIIRHAEKPRQGSGLTRAGTARANAYPAYFERFQIDGRSVHLDALVAAADSVNSSRPRLTLVPLGAALHLPIEQPCESRAVEDLATWLREGRPGRSILIAWHHSDVPRLLSALGQDPSVLLPKGRWRPSIYNLVVVLRFDEHGSLIQSASRIVKAEITKGDSSS